MTVFRLTPSPTTRLWLWTAVLSIGFLVVAGHRLADFHPLSSDDAWIMSASYKLATTGVLGANMFAGFFDADRVYFIALPVQHFLQAGVFATLGANLITARLPALLSAFGIIWLVAVVGRRWFDPLTAAIAVGLLVLWRADFVASGHRPPLLVVAQTGRYDAAAVALMWLTLWLREWLRDHPSPARAVVVGVAAGAAALTQFFGAFVLPLVLLSRFIRTRRWLQAGVIVGLLAVLLPYVFYVGLNWSSFIGQSQLKSGRLALDEPAFYASNLRSEERRYTWQLERPQPEPGAPVSAPFSPWIFLVGAPPATAYLAWRARRASRGFRRLLAFLITVGGGLALVDATKAPLYAIALWPALCLATAVALATFTRWSRTRLWALLPLLGVGLLISVEGAAAYRHHWRLAVEATPYAEVAADIVGALPSEGVIAGSERWWWGLNDRQYLALTGLWARWQEAPEGKRIATLAAEDGITAVIVNVNVGGDILRFSDPLQERFWHFLEECTRDVAAFEDKTYGEVTVLHIVDPPPTEACRP